MISYFACARKLAEVSLIYRMEPKIKTEKQGKETKNKTDILRRNSPKSSLSTARIG